THGRALAGLSLSARVRGRRYLGVKKILRLLALADRLIASKAGNQENRLMRNILAGLVLVFASLLRKVVDGGSMRKLLTGFVFIFASLPCFAQFIGYTSPQTVQVKLATAVTCTGSPQTFITGTTPGFSNIGQTQH